jgi:hypothetical protein
MVVASFRAIPALAGIPSLAGLVLWVNIGQPRKSDEEVREGKDEEKRNPGGEDVSGKVEKPSGGA